MSDIEKTIDHTGKVNTTTSLLRSNETTEDNKNLIISTKKSIIEITTLAFPSTIFMACLFMYQTVGIAFVGRKYEGKDKDIIAGIGITNLYINCFLLSIALGLVGGMETLCSNSYGAKNYYLLGVYTNRTRLIVFTVVFSLVIFNFFFALKIIKSFSMDDQVFYYASRFFNLAQLYVIVDMFFAINFRYMNIIKKSHVTLIILVISISLHPLWCWIFITKLDLDSLGFGLSLVCAQSVNTILTTLYIHIANPLPESYFWFNKDCFTGWWDYLKFSLPTLALTLAEWWAFEIQALITTTISTLDYAVFVVISASSSLVTAIAIGFGIALNILISKYILDPNVRTPKKIALTAFIYGNIVSFTVSAIFNLALGSNMLRMFVKDDDIIEKGTPILYIILVKQIFDYSQTLLNYLLRGLRKQHIASIVASINFYVLQTSFGILLGKILKLGVTGIWIGIGIGNVVSFMAYLIILKRIDFKTIRIETLKRIEEDKKLLVENNEVVTSGDM
jgi:MATE family multidrug resistance protein